jgi:hypothetical protein
MKMLLAAVALVIASPVVAAQTAAPETHHGHGAHAAHGAQHQDHSGHAGHGPAGDEHAQHKMDGKCCDEMADGKKMDCCEKMKGKANDGEHAGHQQH